MPFITTSNLTSINAELTNYCNAACPMCARYSLDGILQKDVVNSKHTTLEFLQSKIGEGIVKQLLHFDSCGNYGDGAMNPQCLEIYEWFRKVNPNIRLELHTNGGARSKEFWKEIAKLGVNVFFAIDGLEDTNHLYRRNVNWNKLMDNVTSFINAGGRADWHMLIFKHNEMQIKDCEALSQKMGFASFMHKQSSRWEDYDQEGNWISTDSIAVNDYFIEKSSAIKSPGIGSGGNSQKMQITKEEFLDKLIVCQACDPNANMFQIYLAANGDVSPCCWLGDLKKHESKNLIKDYTKVNLNYTSLSEILNGEYFSALDKGIRGEKDSFRLHTCYATCGRQS